MPVLSEEHCCPNRPTTHTTDPAADAGADERLIRNALCYAASSCFCVAPFSDAFFIRAGL